MTESGRICVWLVASSVALAPLPLPAEPTAADNHIAYYQRILQRNPRDARTYHRLGDALIRKARESGDVSYFARAEEALRKSLELVPTSAGAWRHPTRATSSTRRPSMPGRRSSSTPETATPGASWVTPCWRQAATSRQRTRTGG